jgi:uncharacterized damage-inducible protein DinB
MLAAVLACSAQCHDKNSSDALSLQPMPVWAVITRRRAAAKNLNMNTPNPSLRTGAIGAILDEYEKALHELYALIRPLSDAALLQVRDAHTEDVNCKSIQTVLAHCVRAGYTYIILINSLKAPIEPYRERIYRTTVADFVADAETMFAFNESSLRNFTDAELEQYDASKKFPTPWGQVYDAEQILEHAIVHILRHRRQILRWLN